MIEFLNVTISMYVTSNVTQALEILHVWWRALGTKLC